MRFDLMQSRERLELEVARSARTDTELRESRELLASITAAAMDAIVMIDHEGSIRYWNPAAAEIFGYTAEQTVGRGPFTFLVAPEKAAVPLDRRLAPSGFVARQRPFVAQGPCTSATNPSCNRTSGDWEPARPRQPPAHGLEVVLNADFTTTATGAYRASTTPAP